MFREGLSKIVSGNDLQEEEATRIMADIMDGQATDAQIGAFMAGLATKGETFAELAGAARAMRRRAIRVEIPGSNVVDTCGTGGDAAGTFNISTTAAFVVAGAGVTVAKHGNRSISSRCGSADLLEALGVDIDTDSEIVEAAIREIGIGFLFAPLYHRAMRYAAKARKEVGIRSIFNMLGPLINPAGADCRLLGVYAAPLTEMIAQALNVLGAKRAFVVHGHDGLDEVSITSETRVTELHDGAIRTYDVSPELLIGRRSSLEDLAGGDARQNAEITLEVLSGRPGPCRDVTVVNAAFALVAAGTAKHLQEGILKAQESIDSGAARNKLEALAAYVRK